MANCELPGDFARKVSVNTCPCPETPCAPGGRVAVTCTWPVMGSSRCTNATTWPSLLRKFPLDTLTSESVFGSYAICAGTEYTFCTPATATFTANVEPT